MERSLIIRSTVYIADTLGLKLGKWRERFLGILTFGRISLEKEKERGIQAVVKKPSPDSLSFAFSGVGNKLTLWQENGHSFIHIRIVSWVSKRIDLRQTLPAQDADRSLNIKLIIEGDGWIAANIYRKRLI